MPYKQKIEQYYEHGSGIVPGVLDESTRQRTKTNCY
jgi:hypothetical protein